MIECKRLGNLNGHTGGSFAYMVYDPNGLAPTINTMGGGGREPMIIEDSYECQNMQMHKEEDNGIKSIR